MTRTRFVVQILKILGVGGIVAQRDILCSEKEIFQIFNHMTIQYITCAKFLLFTTALLIEIYIYW